MSNRSPVRSRIPLPFRLRADRHRACARVPEWPARRVDVLHYHIWQTCGEGRDTGSAPLRISQVGKATGSDPVIPGSSPGSSTISAQRGAAVAARPGRREGSHGLSPAGPSGKGPVCKTVFHRFDSGAGVHFDLRGVAQLGERRVRDAEAAGSSPVTSTTSVGKQRGYARPGVPWRGRRNALHGFHFRREVAQLVERLDGVQQAAGSTPVFPTTFCRSRDSTFIKSCASGCSFGRFVRE